MKKIKVFLIGITLSLVLQTAFLFYLSNYYLVDDYKVTFTQETPKASKKGDIEIKLSVNAKDIKLSPSGKYAYYLLDNVPHVASLLDGKDNIINLSYDISSYFFKWHDYEDKIIISEKSSSKSNSEIKIYIYNAKDNLKQEALDYNNNSRVYKFSTSNVMVSDIQLNTLNTIMYIKASKNNGINYINRLDISDGMYKIPIENNNIGSYFVIKESDELVFEDTSNEKIYITNKSNVEEVKIPTSSKLKLLSVDKDDNIYIGEMENGMIKTIFYNNKNDNEWKSIQLSGLVDFDDLYLFSFKDIYVVDKVEKMVTNITKDKQIKFEGTFIDMNPNRILSLSNENAIVTNLSEKEN